jgi:hypothetical protein
MNDIILSARVIFTVIIPIPCRVLSSYSRLMLTQQSTSLYYCTKQYIPVCNMSLLSQLSRATGITQHEKIIYWLPRLKFVSED